MLLEAAGKNVNMLCSRQSSNFLQNMSGGLSDVEPGKHGHVGRTRFNIIKQSQNRHTSNFDNALFQCSNITFMHDSSHFTKQLQQSILEKKKSSLPLKFPFVNSVW